MDSYKYPFPGPNEIEAKAKMQVDAEWRAKTRGCFFGLFIIIVFIVLLWGMGTTCSSNYNFQQEDPRGR